LLCGSSKLEEDEAILRKALETIAQPINIERAFGSNKVWRVSLSNAKIGLMRSCI